MRTFALLAILIFSTISLVSAKQDRTYYTADKVAAAQEKIAKYPWAKSAVSNSEAASQRWIAMSDQELWDFVPPPEQLRALNVSFGIDCPVHGAEIFRKGGHYPWIMSPDHPFKVKCPVGGEEYPSNDFKPWNTNSIKEAPQSGPGYVDNGAGWTDGKNRYFFVGYYVFWQRWQKEVLPAVSNLAQAYLLTGKPIYAHKCAVLMSKIAQDYPRYDYPTQAYHNGAWPAGINGRILDYIWTTGTTSDMAYAYDAIFPALAGDQELAAFLKPHDIADACQNIEQHMLRTMAEDIMRGFVSGNMGMHQSALARLAIVWDNQDPALGPTTKQMRDWIMTGKGDSEYLLWNGFYRDGHGGESSPGYSSGWVTGYYEVARLLPMLGLDIWSNPKLKKMADIGLDLTVAGIGAPSIGDSGGIQGSGRIGWSAIVQGPAFDHYGDPRFAQALTLMNANNESLWDTLFDAEKVKEIVAKEGTDLGLKTRNLGGYGLAVLESGAGKNRRGVSMYYGHAGGGHGHYDRLTIEMMDSRFDHPMLTDMGYPAHWLDKATYWTNNTISHYDVVVNQTGHSTMFPGYLNTLASAPGLQLMDASAEKVAYPSVTSLYRRSLAMVDLSPESSYLIDIFRVKGGWEHDYSFHGPAFPEFTVTGGQPGPVQEKGTLAGEDVAFGTKPSLQTSSSGVTLALNAAEGVLKDTRPYDQRSNEGWATYSGNSILTRKVGASVTIPANIAAGKVKLFMNIHDYNSGKNVIDVTLGDQTKTFTLEPSGVPGYRFISQIYDLPVPVKTVTVTAREIGQNYLLLDGLTASTDMNAEVPRVWDPSRSGFQYLYNIRHMKPAGGWSATWRDPAKNQALTMTMPEGCAQEIILADAEPELAPGSPKSLQYILARNTGDNLGSTYVAIAEPHLGPAQISEVKRLKTDQAMPETIGLSVRHGDTTDLVHSSLNPGEKVVWQTDKPFEAAAEYALVRIDAQGLQSAYMVNGTSLKYGDFALQAASSPTGKVISVDHKHNSITVEGALTAPEAAVNRVAILGNEKHQTSYTVKQATVANGQTTLNFGDTLFLVGMGKVTGADNEKGIISTDTQFTGYGRVDGGQHVGRWLYNEDKSRGYLIIGFEGGKFRLADVDGDLNTIFADSDGDGLRHFWISDIGPGDTYRLPAITSVQRNSKGLYDVRMMTEVQLTVAK